jgi:oligopeptide/dipeptide ABC transporter ATP-binding protein
LDSIVNQPVSPILSIRGAGVRYGANVAVDGVDLEMCEGEWLGLVGESGCGKSSLGKAIVRLEPLSRGVVEFRGTDIARARGSSSMKLHRSMQLIFQDPYSSLNPRMKTGAIIAEALAIHGLHRNRRRERIAELMELVGLRPEFASRYPHEFSGGQRQRIGIARALAAEPEFLVCDEPISALDVSIQAQILNLLADLQRRLNLTYLFIAHNLPAVAMFSDRIAVMYLGRIVEIGTSEQIQSQPAHPYTSALLDAVPLPDPRAERDRTGRRVLNGDAETEGSGKGCPFRSRCWLYEKKARPGICATVAPEMQPGKSGSIARCHFAGEGAEVTVKL